ncbi:MAG: transposase [Nitrosomonas sp.]|nr:transposase [Nitrosomonas sp.]
MAYVIAEASLLKFVLRLHQALASWEHQATERILNTPAINVDETSFRVDMQNHWIHVYSSDDLTRTFLHRNRGRTSTNVGTVKYLLQHHFLLC